MDHAARKYARHRHRPSASTAKYFYRVPYLVKAQSGRQLTGRRVDIAHSTSAKWTIGTQVIPYKSRFNTLLLSCRTCFFRNGRHVAPSLFCCLVCSSARNPSSSPLLVGKERQHSPDMSDKCNRLLAGCGCIASGANPLHRTTGGQGSYGVIPTEFPAALKADSLAPDYMRFLERLMQFPRVLNRINCARFATVTVGKPELGQHMVFSRAGRSTRFRNWSNRLQERDRRGRYPDGRTRFVGELQA